MPHQIKESDWKIFRRLHQVALERFCQRVIEEINDATSNCNENYHKRYLEVFRLIMDRNEKMARAFDDLRRSRAFLLLANIRESQLLTDEEFSEFSLEACEAVESIFALRRI
jgi:predicted TIM-barrel fold metal-dependent hydrolase